MTRSSPPAAVEGRHAHLRLQEVSKTFRTKGRVVTALDGITLDVARGEFVSIIGPSGCGKSTLLRIVGGLLAPDGGTLEVDGADPAHARAAKHFGLVPQSPALLPWRNVLDNARLLTEVNRGAEDHATLSEAATVDLLRLVGLGDFLHARPGELSGGMRQRVSLVRAFTLGSPILLMDEPFASLDEMSRADMRYLLLDLWHRAGSTVLFVTHSIPEAVVLSDRVVVLAPRPGRIVAVERIGLPRPRTEDLEDVDAFHHHVATIRRALREAGALMNPAGRRLLVTVAPVLGVAAFLAVWQAGVALFDVPRYLLPAPSSILRHVVENAGFYVRNARITMWEATLGFTLALVVAVAVATLMAHSPVVERAVTPLVVLVQVTPVIAYAPAVVIWLGFGLRPILLISALMCAVPFVVNTVTGLRSIDADTYELLRSVDASRREVFWRLRVPHALPYVFSAARIAVGLALVGAVLGEFFAGSTGGLGYAVKTAQARPNLLIDQLWGSIFVLSLLGVGATLLLAALERLVLRWHSSQTSPR